MAEPLKNAYNKTFIEKLSRKLKSADPNFDDRGFEQTIFDEYWEERELKDRGGHITRSMGTFLSYGFDAQIKILDKVAPHFSGYPAIIFPAFVEMFGKNHYDTAIKALEHYTTYSTSEFAIRPFLSDRPETIEIMYKWAKSDNHHVRRLASEGCRPLLPWAMKLNQYVEDPTPIIPILETLRNDPEDYVYRSVANNLNDISKNHPELVLNLCKKWINESNTTRWVCKHALRTLLKKGNQDAMRLFGFGPIKAIRVDQFEMKQNNITIGDSTQLQIGITNTGNAAQFRMEYVVGYLKKNNSHNEKVFQLREKQIEKNESLSFSKKLDFKDLTTRKHYAGPHYLCLKINGIVVEKVNFELS